MKYFINMQLKYTLKNETTTTKILRVFVLGEYIYFLRSENELLCTFIHLVL